MTGGRRVFLALKEITFPYCIAYLWMGKFLKIGYHIVTNECTQKHLLTGDLGQR